MAYGQFNPTAVPRDTVGLPGAGPTGAGPIRQNQGPAPSQLSRPADASRMAGAPTDDALVTLVNSLKGVAPQIEGLANDYWRDARKDEAKVADADATQASLKANVDTWAAAVAKDPSLADKSPWYRQIYEGRLAQTAIQRKSGSLLAEYSSTNIAGSTDPGAIRPWLQSRMAGALDQFTSPAARAAAADELRKSTEQFVTAHQRNAAANLVKANEDSFSSALGTTLDKWAATDGKDKNALLADWQRLEADAKAQGVDGRTINATMSKALATGMIRLGRSDLSTLATAPRADGTPGFGTTVTGRAEMVQANEHLLGRQVQLENLAYTRQQRARATADRDAEGEVAASLIDQINRGQDPRLDPSMLARVGRNAPEVVTKALAMQRSLRSYSQQEDPKLVATAEAEFYKGGGTVQDVADMAQTGKFSPETITRLYGLARQNAEDNGLKATGISEIINNTMNVVGEVAEISGIMKEGVKAAAAGKMLREEAIAYKLANPNATSADQVLNLQKKQQDVIRALRPDFNATPLDGKAPPRNVRNNTPIPMNFVGQPGAVSDGRFAKFGTPEQGVDANLAQYERYQKSGKLSLTDMILTATPRSENPRVDSYIAAVARDMKIRPDQPVDLRDPATAASFIMAAARQEGGSFDAETVVRGVLQHLKGQPGELGGDPGQAPVAASKATPLPAPVKPPTPAEQKAKAEQDAITYAPRANAEWKAQPLFPDAAQFNAALQQEVKGGGSQLLRQWFQILNLNTPEDQRRFVSEQRRLLAGAR